MLATNRIVILLVGAMLVASCNRFTEARLFGTWREDNEINIEEIALNKDHTYRALISSKTELVIPSPLEETGTWRVEGNQIKLDGTVTWSKERSVITMILLRITGDTLVTKKSDANINSTYTRLQLPACAGSVVSGKHALNEADLFGTWQIHCNTHDYQYSLKNDHSVSAFAAISGETRLLDEGTWRLSGNDLVMRLRSSSDGSAAEDEKWTITGAEADCFAIKVGRISYALTRVK
jgi:hypothetical protein